MLVLKCLGLGKDLTLYFVPSIMYHLPLNPSLLLLPILTSNQVHNVTDPANRQFYFSWDWLVLFVPFLLRRLIKQIICLFFLFFSTHGKCMGNLSDMLILLLVLLMILSNQRLWQIENNSFQLHREMCRS